MTVSRDSVLLITLDSCRYDTFAAAPVPCMKAVGPLHRAQAPSYFTFASHMAMFVGFTPGLPAEIPYLNPKTAKLFRLGPKFAWQEHDAYVLGGRDIVCGFRDLGFRTIGTGAPGWFDPGTETGRILTENFDDFLCVGLPGDIDRQVAYVQQAVDQRDGDIFAFVNVGETHVPYYHKGACWDPDDNPCVPFQQVDRAADCRARQIACCTYVDQTIAPLLERFSGSTIMVTSDHGDCWGEDGLWEHGISHWATLTVPLVLRLRGEPIGLGQ
jgi:hypothetical protein